MQHERGPERATSLSEGLFRMVEVHAPRKAGLRRPHAPHLDLVLFDMDGTLVEGSSWEMVHTHFGVSNHKNWEAYCRDEIDDLEFIRSDIALWHVNGTRPHVSDIERVFQHTHPFPGAKELVQTLHEHGVNTMIMSGGLDVLARRVCELTGIERYVANGFHVTDGGHLTGDGYCSVKINDKGLATKEALKRLGVDPQRVAAIGNTKFDLPMFRQCGMGVAFAPLDDEVVAGARAVVRDPDMRHIWPHLLQYRP